MWSPRALKAAFRLEKRNLTSPDPGDEREELLVAQVDEAANDELANSESAEAEVTDAEGAVAAVDAECLDAWDDAGVGGQYEVAGEQELEEEHGLGEEQGLEGEQGLGEEHGLGDEQGLVEECGEDTAAPDAETDEISEIAPEDGDEADPDPEGTATQETWTAPANGREEGSPTCQPVRTTERSAAGWVARTNLESGFVLLARGTGRAEPIASALFGAVEVAVTDSNSEGPASSESTTPPAVTAVVALLRAIHQDLRLKPEDLGTDALDVLVGIAEGDRVYIVLAGQVACLRFRASQWELLAPLGRRARPALGETARALIEVTSEPARPDDLILAVPGDSGSEAGEIPEGGWKTAVSIASWAWRSEGDLAPLMRWSSLARRFGWSQSRCQRQEPTPQRRPAVLSGPASSRTG
jgi:hypothetical protein